METQRPYKFIIQGVVGLKIEHGVSQWHAKEKLVAKYSHIQPDPSLYVYQRYLKD